MTSTAYLAQLGIPFGGPPVILKDPAEEFQASPPAKAASAATSSKAPTEAKSEKADGAPDGRSFLEKWIEADLAKGGRCEKLKEKVLTRFPPEPNGYLHIGHAKSIMINFGLAYKYGGQCNLRFDDTNPDTEETEYVEAIQEDVAWVCQALNMEKMKKGGKPWKDEVLYASDYFQQMYDFAIDLIKHGKAYVDSQTPEEVQKNRGGGPNNLPGVDSKFRNRSVEENLKLFQEMQDGKHAEGSQLLRAKIDMQHPNMNMRDPPMYRIRFSSHHRSGDKWKVYPMYDFAHGNEDAIEGVTHSICTLEFENHRALYDWFLDNCSIIPSRPYQKEFARLEVQGAVTSKRKLLRLVKEGHVSGWDDPRLLTIRGIRRRGVRPQGLKCMADGVGVSDRNSTTPWDFVEECWREDLEPISKRRLAVLDPLEVEIVDYNKEELIEGITDLPEQSASSDPSCARTLSFSKSLFIDRGDYQENPPEGYFRLGAIGSEVKLRHSYVIKLKEVIKDKSGTVTKLKCSHDPATRDTMPADRKPKVIHWVNAKDCLDAEVRLINPLFLAMPDPMPEGKDFLDYINPEAMVRCAAKVEKALGKPVLEDRYQFERVGYFAPDYDCFSEPKKLSFNRVVPLKESADKKKIEGKGTASRKEAQQAQLAEKERLQKIPPEELMRHHSRMEKLLQGTVEQIHQAVRQELESLRVKDIDARPMEASSSSISRNLPGMTLEAYFQAQEEKMEKKITKQRTFGSRHTEPAGDMENPLSTLEAWTGDHFPDAASENEEDETSMSQARKSRFNMLEKNKVKGVKDWLEHRKKSQIFMDEVPPWRRWAKHVVRNSKFEWLCAALILLCALMIGAEAHYQVTHVGEQEPLAFRVLNTCFNVAFTVELCLRIMVDQLFFFSCRNASIHWNLLDSILVSIAVVEEFLALVMSPALQMSGLKILRMVRLARILRIVRVVRFFSELRVMLNGVIGSGKSLCWALLLLVGVNFLFGVVFMQLSVDFLENSEASSSRHAELLRYFGSLPRTMLTLYQAISGGIDWYNAVVVLYPVGDWIEYIFSAYVFFTVFCCLNIVTGIFVDNAKALKVADEEAMHHEAMKERQKWITEVAELFSKISVEKDAKLTKDDFIYHVTNSDRINTCFYHLGINTETTNTDELWELFDMDANGVIDQDEFAIGIKQFHGFARSIDLFKLRKEVREILKQVNKMFLVEPE